MKYGTFLVLTLFLSNTTFAYEIKSGDDPSLTGGGVDPSPVYMQEMKCILNKLYPSADEKQKNRAYHFARTLGDLTSGWSPVLAANWRRHLYAQLIPETTFFKVNVEQEPIQSKLADERYKGRGWIQLTHKENYAQYACFKKALDQQGSTSSIDQLQDLATTRGKSCEHKNIVSDPDAAFKYTDVSDYNQTTDANKNNDLSTIWYFLSKAKEQKTFDSALKSADTSAVQKVRRGVNIGDSNSSKTANGEDKSIKAFNDIGSCFNN